MSKPSRGEGDRPPEGRRTADARNRPAGRTVPEDDQYKLAGETHGTPIWKPSILKQRSLHVSSNMACKEFDSYQIKGWLAPDDTETNREVPPPYARHEVLKSNLLMALHPSVGNLRKQSMDLHPSVGSFKKKVGSECF